MRRSLLLALSNLLLLSGLLAAGVWSSGGPVVPDPPQARQVDTIELNVCLEKVRPKRQGVSLMCGNGGGFGGPIGGPGVRGPASQTGWATKNGAYGRLGRGVKPTKTASMRVIERQARANKVPWPSPKAKRAKDMSPYGVYHMYAATSRGYRVYKFGITKRGARRPEAQLARCRRVMGAECFWLWTRTDVKGWLRARRVEAAYANKFVAKNGKCPPGMLRCL